MGPYYPDGFKPVALYGTTEYVRAAPGGNIPVCILDKTFELILLIGTGAYKIGANYAPGVLPQKFAAHKGYQQNLWLHGPEHYLTEVFRHETLSSAVG